MNCAQHYIVCARQLWLRNYLWGAVETVAPPPHYTFSTFFHANCLRIVRTQLRALFCRLSIVSSSLSRIKGRGHDEDCTMVQIVELSEL